jgi:hypothetical protein
LAQATTLIQTAARKLEDAGTRERLDIKETLDEALEALEGKIQRSRLLKDHVDGPSIAVTLITDINAMRISALNPNAVPNTGKPDVGPHAGETKADPKPEAGETKADPKPEAGETKADPKPEAGETKADPKPEAGETKADPKPEAGETKADPKPEAGETKADPTNIDIDKVVNAEIKRIEQELSQLSGRDAITRRVDLFLDSGLDNLKESLNNKAGPDGLSERQLERFDALAAKLRRSRDTTINDAVYANTLDARLVKRVMEMGGRLGRSLDSIPGLNTLFRAVSLNTDAMFSNIKAARAAVTRAIPYVGKPVAPNNSKTVHHFTDHMRDATETMLDSLKGADSANFSATRDAAVADYRAMADQLEIALNRFDKRGGPKLAAETDIPMRFLAPHMNFNISGMQKEALEQFIQDMRIFADQIDALETVGKSEIIPGEPVTGFETFMLDAAQRINGKGTIWNPADFFIASTFEVGNLKKENGVILPGQTNLAQQERLVRAASQGFRPSTQRTMVISGNRENYAYSNIERLVIDADPNSAAYLESISQTLWEVYERGLEVDSLAHLEFAVNSLGDDPPNSSITQSDPVQKFDRIIQELREKVIREQKAVTGEVDGERVITDKHFLAFIERLEKEAKQVWEPNPQGTVATIREWILGRDYDGRGHSRRENRKRVAYAALPDMINTQYRESFEATGATKPTDAGRSYFKNNQLPRAWQFLQRYLRGHEMDYTASYSGENGLYSDPRGFRWQYHDRPEGAKYTLNPVTWFSQGSLGRHAFNSAWRLTGLGLPEMALWMIPRTAFGGRAVYLGSKNVRYAARIAGILGWSAAIESWTDEDSNWRYHPSLLLDDPAETLVAVPTGTLWNATAGWVLPKTDAGFFNDERWWMPYGDPLTLGSQFTGIGQPSASTSGPRTPTTAGETVDPTLAASLEADYVRKWVDAKLEDAAEVERLKLPNGYWSAEEDAAYRDRVIVEAAKLLQADAAKPAADRIYPAINRSGANNFEAVWTAARTNVNEQIRATMIENALVNAYRKDRNRDESYDPKADPQNKFTDVLALLIKERGIAPINSALMVSDPWDDTTQDAFVARAMYYQQMVIEKPQRIQLVKDLIIAELGLDKDNLATDVQQALNTISTRYADMQGLNGNFYSLDGLRSSKDQIVEAFNTELNTIKRTAAATDGFTAWLDANQGNMPEFTDLSTARQNEVKAVVIERLAALPATPFTNAILASTDNADLNAKREEFVNEAITAILTLPAPAPASTPKIEGDTDGNGDLSDAERAALAAKRAAAKPGTDFSLSLADTKSAASNVFNSLTDIDGDGVSAFIDTEFGRSVSGTFQQITGAATSMFGNLSQTEDGKQMIGIGAGVIAALALPNLAKNIPILKHIANIPVVGGIAMAFLGFFLATKGANAIFNGALDAPDKTDPKNPAATTGDEGDKTGGEGDTQGGGGHLPVEGKGYKVKIQTHDGKLPQIITIEGDFDGDPETKEVMNFFDTNRDGVYAAQLFSADGSESWVAPSLLGKDVVDGALNLFVPNAPRSRASLEANQEIKVEAIDNNDDGQTDSFKLTIGGTVYTLDHKLDGIMDDADLKTLEPQQ